MKIFNHNINLNVTTCKDYFRVIFTPKKAPPVSKGIRFLAVVSLFTLAFPLIFAVPPVFSWLKHKVKKNPVTNTSITSVASRTLSRSSEKSSSSISQAASSSASQVHEEPIAQIQKVESRLPSVIKRATDFKNYGIDITSDKVLTFLKNRRLILTAVSLRPSNFFFEALGVRTTLPDSGKLFAHENAEATAQVINNLGDDEVIEFSAQGKKVQLKCERKGQTSEEYDATEIYGEATYRLSGKEIKKTLESQEIFMSPSLDKDFYRELKVAMQKDRWVELPGHEGDLLTISKLAKRKGAVGDFLRYAQPIDKDYYNRVKNLTIYELGSMVVKREDFHVFVDGNGKILEREANSTEPLRLISACGIRGFHRTKTKHETLQEIMKNTYKTALEASESGFVLFPAVGLGVWAGDPHVYWKAFIEAVLESDRDFDKIFVNPGHKPTEGKYKNQKEFPGQWNGDEFKFFMEKYSNHKNASRLQMIHDLTTENSTGKDLVQLGRELKLEFPGKTVSIFNASDPDVTLGNHVGEYVNNWPHTNTTEENFTALGTNGLCFEQITGVHKNPERIIQVTE